MKKKSQLGGGGRRPSYAYVALAAGVIGSVMTVPGQTNGISPFIDMIIEALGLSRVWVSSAYMIGTAASALLLTHAGALYDRFGARLVGAGSAVLLGASLVGLSRAGQGIEILDAAFPVLPRHWIAVALLSAGFLGARFFGQGVLSMVSRNMIMTWFNDKRGPANAVLGTSIAISFAFAPTLFDHMIRRFGWSGAWTVLGLILFGFAIFVFLTYRDARRPRSKGGAVGAARVASGIEGQSRRTRRRHGRGESETSDRAVAATAIRFPAPRLAARILHHLRRREPLHPHADFTLAEAKRTWILWVFCAGLGLGSLVGTGFTFHVVDLLGSVGVSRQAALAVFVPSSLISVVIQMVGNIASDYTRLKFLVAAQMLGVCVTSVAVTVGSPVAAYWLAALGLATSTGLAAVVSVVAWPRYFGLSHLGAVSGFAFSWMVAGSALGPYTFSLAKSLSGDYRLAAALFILMSIVIAVTALRTTHPLRP